MILVEALVPYLSLHNNPYILPRIPGVLVPTLLFGASPGEERGIEPQSAGALESKAPLV